MTAVMLIAAAIFGGLFWGSRRRRYYYGPVLVSDGTSETDVIAGDVDAYCDDAETFCRSDAYQDDSSPDSAVT